MSQNTVELYKKYFKNKNFGQLLSIIKYNDMQAKKTIEYLI